MVSNSEMSAVTQGVRGKCQPHIPIIYCGVFMPPLGGNIIQVLREKAENEILSCPAGSRGLISRSV